MNENLWKFGAELGVVSPAFQDPSVIAMQWLFVSIFALSAAVTTALKLRASPYFLSSLPLLALASHQVEEYLVSPLILGAEYHFLNWAFDAGFYIPAASVVAVNLLGYAGTTALYLCKPSSLAFVLVFMFINAMSFANGMFHIGIATLQSSYSPGAITALVVYMPLYLKSVAIAFEHDISFKKIYGLTCYGFIAHFLLLWLI